MPIVRFGFNGLVGGTLLALLCGSINPASAQPASPTAASSFSGTYKGTTSLAGDRQAEMTEVASLEAPSRSKCATDVSSSRGTNRRRSM